VVLLSEHALRECAEQRGQQMQLEATVGVVGSMPSPRVTNPIPHRAEVFDQDDQAAQAPPEAISIRELRIGVEARALPVHAPWAPT
jgi:hypothetical protein